MDADDPAITPNVNPQLTDEDGGYYWEAAEGDYRVSVTAIGYWRLRSATVSASSAVMNLDLPLKRRPGTPPPKPRDCSGVDEPEPPEEPGEPRAAGQRPGPERRGRTCMFRPVNARVRGRMIRKVVFTLDGRAVEIVRSPDSEGRFGVTVERRPLSQRQAHAARQGRLRPEREARPGAPAARLPALPGAGDPEGGRRPARRRSAAHVPFLAWVRGAHIRGVLFRLDGRTLGSVSVADWRGRYGVQVNPERLREGKHVVSARIEFLPGSGLKQRTVRLSFRKCA